MRRASGRQLCSIVFEQVLLQPFKRDRSKEARRDDSIGIDVVPRERERAPGDLLNLFNRH